MHSQTENEITVLIADDHPILRKGLAQMIELEDCLKIVAEADDGDAAFELIETHKPQVAVLDISMPKSNGFAVAKAVKEKQLDTEIIFLTMYKEEDAFDKALVLGVKGYVLKDSAVTDIIKAIKAVADGQIFISPSISSYLFSHNQRMAKQAQQESQVESLTATELKVLKLISENKSTKEIAEELFISPRTVDKHRANICEKLNLHGSSSLLKFALQYRNDF